MCRWAVFVCDAAEEGRSGVPTPPEAGKSRTFDGAQGGFAKKLKKTQKIFQNPLQFDAEYSMLYKHACVLVGVLRPSGRAGRLHDMR